MTQRTRIYLQYKESENDIVTLVFRSKKTLQEFLKNKKCKPIYLSTERPKQKIELELARKIRDVIKYIDYIASKGGDIKV